MSSSCSQRPTCTYTIGGAFTCGLDAAAALANKHTAPASCPGTHAPLTFPVHSRPDAVQGTPTHPWGSSPMDLADFESHIW
jgi:hypothetical protein